MTMATVTKAFFGAALSVSLSLGTANGADLAPFLGTWVLAPAKSTHQGKELPKSQTMVVTDEGDGMLHYAVDWVDADSKPGHVEYSLKADGKVYPVKSDDYDGAKASMVNSHKVNWYMMKGGKATDYGNDTISKDGKTTYELEKGTVNGKPFSYHLVLERQ